MNGVLILSNNYTYEGSILHNEPHGYGIFYYNNGDRYIGQCQFGRSDGYGTYYYKSGAMYQGYFSYGKFHGIGTYEDAKNITKGSWRSDNKHGHFIKTNKLEQVSSRQLWLKHKMKHEERIEYIQPDALRTVKENPNKKPKKYQVKYHGSPHKCIGCMDKPITATNSACGHVCMCYECLIKCNKCPICRCEMEKVVQLYVS